MMFGRLLASHSRVLCLGAHSDDIEIGCGGTILRLIKECPDLCVCWVVFSSNDQRSKEALDSAHALLSEVRDRNVIVKSFKDGYFPYAGAEIKDYFEQLKQLISPDVIFTHYRLDLHQDHRVLNELTWNTFRNHLILEYEIPKYDGDIGTPNFFVSLDESTCRRKIKHILDNFKTQTKQDWFTEDTFLAMLRLRGIECRMPDRYAEAFYCRKFSF
jgi:LmbE family N-acetylglucosaminyl deacetylase